MASPQWRGDGREIVLSDRQGCIASWLTLVGPGRARFFRDACELMDEDPPRATVTHLVSHLLREVESAVRAVVEPPQAAAISGHTFTVHGAGIKITRSLIGRASSTGQEQG